MDTAPAKLLVNLVRVSARLER
ncbi:MAG: hypothetical protein QOI92_3032, partial [Chloroflexota bacterium]|nr:hypothetical protein [Chloroflexota bacterium]